MHYARWRVHGDVNFVLKPHSASGLTQAFLSAAVSHTDAGECLTWPYALNAYGRAVINVGGGKIRQVSRLVCEQVYGPPPLPKMDAAHSCGNGHLGCVNPRHLRWATKAENEADKELHGTRARGERTHNAFLTEDVIRQIRTCGLADREVAAKFGIKKKYVWMIRSRKVWKHVA